MKRYFIFATVNIAILAMLSIVASIFGLDRYTTAYGIDYQALLLISLFWGMGGSFISLLLSKFMAKQMVGVQIIDGDPRFQTLVHKVHSYAQKAGLQKMPEVGIFESGDLNAFATGPSKNNSLVAVSTGLLHGMNDDEIDGVIAHEISHIANGDMVTMTLIQGVINAFVMFLARIVAFAIDNFLRKSDDEGEGLGGFAYYGVVIALQIIFGIIGSIVVMWFSRYREYAADNGGARLAGKHKMIAALKRLQTYYPQMESGNNAVAAMQISNKSSFASLFSSHPSLETRIEALQRQTQL